MTNNEAIGILAIVVETAKGRCFVTDEAISDAYAMAIKALEAQEAKTQLPGEGTTSDLISRQAAIDVCDNAIDLWHGQLGEGIVIAVKKKIEELLPAQPEIEERTEEFAQNVPKEDLISRKAAIDALDNIKIPRNASWYPYYQQALTVMSRLPSAQPEPQWIPVSERLPEYGVAVLTYDGHCFCVEKRIPTIRDDEGEPITGDWWVSDDYDEYDGDYYPNLRDGACIAWMPLPEPHRTERGTDE